MVHITMKDRTIPHEIRGECDGCIVLLKPACPGTGVIAGGPVRVVVEAAGIRNIVAKILGTNNKASNVYAAIEALKQLRSE